MKPIVSIDLTLALHSEFWLHIYSDFWLSYAILSILFGSLPISPYTHKDLVFVQHQTQWFPTLFHPPIKSP